jgi:hypothetical protein
MGEANRRSKEFQIRRQEFEKDSAGALVGSVLQNIAEILECVLCVKEPGDDLLDWPLDAIVGKTFEITKARECPFISDIREKLFPRIHWEFLISSKFLTVVYCVDAMKRGLSFPGPIDPDRVAEYAARLLKIGPDGFKAVVPSYWATSNERPN